MHNPTRIPAGPADLALPLALVAELAGRRTSEPPRVPEVRTTTARKRRAARRRAAAVRG
ncbi:hypothetical protein [Streptomyces sp. NBC_01618]|uniref:hypothetical protein n=1 Tax=Streptomyces sp. NBC_01618 TaxID=2975900 RepID=UPI003867CEB2|nr:hypothetical protein OH735_20175 [Streptomyces sp. NBC_01618]